MRVRERERVIEGERAREYWRGRERERVIEEREPERGGRATKSD